MNEEQSRMVQGIAGRLGTDYPSVGRADLLHVVQSAYRQFHGAKVQAYVPILVERRARTILDESGRQDRARHGR
ncbi:hypothetical protein OHV05_36350 (plasmid) [Kitasatospora sp. NBC_00070]